MLLQLGLLAFLGELGLSERSFFLLEAGFLGIPGIPGIPGRDGAL